MQVRGGYVLIRPGSRAGGIAMMQVVYEASGGG